MSSFYVITQYIIYDCLFYFNRRSRKGSDAPKSISSLILSKFQSTLPRGERPSGSWFSFTPIQFQSTLPRGERRFISLQFNIFRYISIHAPTRGATKSLNELKRQCIFQSTLPRGERRRSSAHNWDICNFNPRSHEGSDPCSYIGLISLGVISIHAPTRGATHTNLQKFQP